MIIKLDKFTLSRKVDKKLENLTECKRLREEWNGMEKEGT